MSIIMVGSWLFTLNDGNFPKCRGHATTDKHAVCEIDKVRDQSHKLFMRLNSKVIEKILFTIIAYFYFFYIFFLFLQILIIDHLR